MKWRTLNHPNVAIFHGLAFEFGNLPALVLQFYQYNIIDYLKKGEHSDASKLEMVLVNHR
jgi:hypothetical protein